jgi:hypothetical protein
MGEKSLLLLLAFTFAVTLAARPSLVVLRPQNAPSFGFRHCDSYGPS